MTAPDVAAALREAAKTITDRDWWEATGHDEEGTEHYFCRFCYETHGSHEDECPVAILDAALAASRTAETGEPEYAKLLESIRLDYERLVESQWFKEVYDGKSLGDVLAIDAAETRGEPEGLVRPRATETETDDG